MPQRRTADGIDSFLRFPQNMIDMNKIDFSCPKCGCENTVKVTPKMFDGTSTGQWVWWGIMIIIGILSGGIILIIWLAVWLSNNWLSKKNKELAAGNRWIMKCSRCGNEFLVDNPEQQRATSGIVASKFANAPGPCAVRLVGVPPEKKIATIKALREITGLGLVEAKTMSEQLGAIIVSSISEEAANGIVAALRNAGADAVVEGVPTSFPSVSDSEERAP